MSSLCSSLSSMYYYPQGEEKQGSRQWGTGVFFWMSTPIQQQKKKNLRNLLSSDWSELGHMAIVSCKGGWDSEYLQKEKKGMGLFNIDVNE